MSIVPFPKQASLVSGEFVLESGTTIRLSQLDDPELEWLADYTRAVIREMSGLQLAVSTAAAGDDASAIVLRLVGGTGSEPEGYRLAVSRQSIAISAETHAGLFYGVQTLRQLLLAAEEKAGSLAIPAIEIEDSPRFVYRGMHLDVGRHFFPVEFIKKYIDLMAMYKMNTFHWHLTEDQGWRIEIKKYPRLTEVGAYRKETILERNFDPYVGDKKPYGGYYTQDEIREVVAYAKSRYITVIPEIEMPGHSLGALAAYPELACTPGPFEPATVWGVHEDIYCPSEQTFAFLEGVLGEVMELFPSRYIHIGGDEAPKARWEESALAQEVMRREGLADEDELQSYFIQRIERFLLEHDRRLIGWDEILEGGLAPEATVMSWRGTQGGIEAARQGHDVIMTPTSHVYFDYYQGEPEYEPLAIGGYTPLETVYDFEPVPDELSPVEAEHVLGAQGNVWTEYMKTPQYVEYMVFPRMLALSEVLWSPQDVRDWERFAAALPAQFQLLDSKRVNYRVPHVGGLERDRITLNDRLTVALTTLIPEAEIRYTDDGSDPTERSMLYAGPIELPVDSVGTVITTRAYLPNGRASANSRATFKRTTLREAEDIDSGDLRSGLRRAYFEFDADVGTVDDLAGLEPQRVGVVETVDLQGDERPERFGLVFEGFIRVARDGIYVFELTSDDGSVLTIGDEVVIDNDGAHGPTQKIGPVALEAGYHSLTIRYYQGGGGSELHFGVMMEGDSVSEGTTATLYHER